MKTTIFSENLQGKALRSAQATHKRAVREALRDYAAALDGAFKRVAQSADKRARDVANAAKGRFASEASAEITALVASGALDAHGARLYVAAYIVARCYPWQAADGSLMCKRTEEREDGERVKVWRPRKLTKGAADGIMTAALCHYVATCGKPSPETHEDGELVGVSE